MQWNKSEWKTKRTKTGKIFSSYTLTRSLTSIICPFYLCVCLSICPIFVYLSIHLLTRKYLIKKFSKIRHIYKCDCGWVETNRNRSRSSRSRMSISKFRFFFVWFFKAVFDLIKMFTENLWKSQILSPFSFLYPLQSDLYVSPDDFMV